MFKLIYSPFDLFFWIDRSMQGDFRRLYIFYNIYDTVLSGFLTPIFMIIFGFLTIRNLKRIRQRINVQVNINRMPVNQQTGGVNRKSREYGTSIMILVQLGVYLVTCLPFPMYLVYSIVTIQRAISCR